MYKWVRRSRIYPDIIFYVSYRENAARYIDKFPINTFPSASISASAWPRFALTIRYQTNTYIPPVLPSHINVSLEPILGAPSDDEVKLVHNALRVSENLANGT